MQPRPPVTSRARGSVLFLLSLVSALLTALAACAQYSSPPNYTGTNPSPGEIRAKLVAAGQKYRIPAQLLFGIAFQESSWNQFNPADGGRTKYHLEPDGRVGVGLMQVTVSPAASDYQQLCTDIDYNIDRGAAILIDKWNQTPVIGDGLGNSGREKLENWYYALWAYNGWVSANSPYYNADCYENKVLYWVANCPNEQWQNCQVTKPDPALVGWPPPPHIDTPTPIHLDADFNGVIDGTSSDGGPGGSGSSGSVPLFWQQDPTWKGDLLGFDRSDTIGDYGCAITSVAMLFKYYGANTDPRELNNWLKSHNGYVSSDLLVWSAAAGRAAGVTYAGSNDWQNVPADLGIVNAELDAGYPAVAETRLKGHLHFVLITSHSGGTYFINDPWTGKAGTLNHEYGDPATFIFGIRKYRGRPAADTTPPVAAIDSPGAGATVSGTWGISGWALDPESGIRELHLLVDDNDLGYVSYPERRDDGNPGYHLNWDTGSVLIGPHTLKLRVINKVGLVQEYSRGIVVSRDLALVQAPGDSSVHLVQNGVRRAFNTADCFFDWGGDFSRVQSITREALNRNQWDVPIPHLIKTPDDATAYWIQDGYRRPIAGGDIFTGMGFSWNDIVVVSVARRDHYTQGKTLTAVEPNLIIMTGPVLPSAADLYVGNPATVEFRVRNIAAVGTTVQALLFSVRGPDGAIDDFPSSGSMFLAPGQEATYRATRALPLAGRYTFNPTFLINGNEYHTIRGSGLEADGRDHFDVASADPVTAVTLAQPQVLGGSTVSGTVNVGGPAPTGGLSVMLASTSGAVSVPASVTIPAGATSAPFAGTTVPVSASSAVTITAKTPGGEAAGAVTVMPPSVAALTVAPSSARGGSSVTGSVTLDGPAPAGGKVINLSSSDASIAQVPATATVPAGGTAVTFPINTVPVASSASITLRVAQGGVEQSTPLTVLPPNLTGLTVSPSSVTGGASLTGQVSLDSPAPAGGLPVTLSSSSSAAVTPSIVTIPAGATSNSFSISTTTVAGPTDVTFTAQSNGQTRTASCTLQPQTASAIQSFSIAPTELTGGSTSAGTVVLNQPSPAGGSIITLASSDPHVVIPTSVTVPAGQKAATFTASSLSVPSTTAVVLMAAFGSATATARMTLQPPAPAAFTITPTSVTGGAAATGEVRLNASAPVGGMVVTVTSNNPVVTPPATVTVPAGSLTATFAISTTVVTVDTSAAVTTTAGGSTLTATLTVHAGTQQQPTLQSLVFEPASVVGGTSSTGTVTLTAPATGAGLTVTLNAASSSLAVPGTVTVAPGQSSATFTVGTVPVATEQRVTVTAAVGAVSVTGSLTLRSSSPLLDSVTLNPTSARGGTTFKGWVTLSGAAPPGGVRVQLKSDNPALTLPALVTIPARKSSVKWTAHSRRVSRNTTVTITAAWSGSTSSATIVLRP